jgi:hypothetical protein
MIDCRRWRARDTQVELKTRYLLSLMPDREAGRAKKHVKSAHESDAEMALLQVRCCRGALPFPATLPHLGPNLAQSPTSFERSTLRVRIACGAVAGG